MLITSSTASLASPTIGVQAKKSSLLNSEVQQDVPLKFNGKAV